MDAVIDRDDQWLDAVIDRDDQWLDTVIDRDDQWLDTVIDRDDQWLDAVIDRDDQWLDAVIDRDDQWLDAVTERAGVPASRAITVSRYWSHSSRSSPGDCRTSRRSCEASALRSTSRSNGAPPAHDVSSTSW